MPSLGTLPQLGKPKAMLADLTTNMLRLRLKQLNKSPTLATWDERAEIVRELVVRQTFPKSRKLSLFHRYFSEPEAQ